MGEAEEYKLPATFVSFLRDGLPVVVDQSKFRANIRVAAIDGLMGGDMSGPHHCETCKGNGGGDRGGPKDNAKPTVGRGDLCHSLSFNRGVRPPLGRANQEHQPF